MALNARRDLSGTLDGAEGVGGLLQVKSAR